MTDASPAHRAKAPPNVPRWLVRTIWFAHRTLLRVTGGRLGLRPSNAKQWGMLQLTSVGRRSGKPRVAILGFIEDGPNLVTPAMNGWADAEPAWWLNLQANPARLGRPARTAAGARWSLARRSARSGARLWRALVDLGSSAYTDASAALRSRETSIVVLEPVPADAAVTADVARRGMMPGCAKHRRSRPRDWIWTRFAQPTRTRWSVSSRIRGCTRSPVARRQTWRRSAIDTSASRAAGRRTERSNGATGSSDRGRPARRSGSSRRRPGALAPSRRSHG